MGNINAVIDPLLAKFRDEVCLNATLAEGMDDLHWKDMSIGWFLANGCNLDAAQELASIARYKHEYWTKGELNV